MLPEAPAALEGLSVDTLCARLHLAAQADGSFRHAGPPLLVLLPAAVFLPWQRSSHASRLHHVAGAPLALSLSPDGHHAEARHMQKDRTDDIAAACWHTAETLGHWSLIALERADGATLELAAPDWFPTPMAAPQGHG